MPALRTKKLWKSLAGAALAATLVVAPLVTAGASATDLIGEVGDMQAATPAANSVDYWEDLYSAHGASCYKSEGNTSHGKLTDGNKTVTLYAYQDSWPGDHWELLVVKAGNTNNVIEHPQAGVAYASPANSGGQQAQVSHWIVCKGTTPTQTPVAVTPTLTFSLPTCEIAGSVTKSDNVEWTQTANPDGSTLWKAVAKAGQVLAKDAQFQWTVPNLSKLAADLEICRGPQPPAEETSELSSDYDCTSVTVTVTTTTNTTPYVWDGKAWVAGETTSVETEAVRPMTNAEKLDCPLPSTTVEYAAWEDGEWDCGDTQVTQTREVTTTVYEYDEQANPTAKSSVAIETKTRDLSQAEIGTCPLVPGGIHSSCVGDVPFLDYGVALPEGFVVDSETPLTITFVNPDGEDYVVSGQPLTGKLLWPGASTDAPKMWPGWALVDGEYVKTDGNFAWTREGVTVRFTVNPTYETALEYPEATALCANPLLADPEEPGTEEPGTDEPGTVSPSDPSDSGEPAGGEATDLAATGSTVPVWAIGGGSAALLAGIGLITFAVMRRRTHTS